MMTDPDLKLYLAKEKEFISRTDALCENEIPEKCDCKACAVKELCDWICENDPRTRERR